MRLHVYTHTKQKRKEGGYYFRNKHTYCPVSGLITGTYSISHHVMCQSLVAYRQANRILLLWPSSRPRLFSSSSRQGCRYGRLCLLSEWLYLFVVVCKKAMWAHTLDACISWTQVESQHCSDYAQLWHQQAASKHDDRAHICCLKNVSVQTAQPGQNEWACLIKCIVLLQVLCI